MTELLLWIFIAICCGLLFWGFIHKTNIYQYPFIIGASLCSYIVPQAIALVNHPQGIADVAIQRVLLMCCLCAAMSWIGYQIKIPRNWSLESRNYLSEKRLNFASFIYIGIGLIFVLISLKTTPEYGTSSFRAGFSGIITVYLFFARLLDIGFVILLLVSLKKKKITQQNLIVLSIVILIQIVKIVIGGRREVMIFFAFSLLLPLFFIRRFILPRFLVILGLIVSMFIINPHTINQYRSLLGNGGSWLKFQEISLTDVSDSLEEIDFVDNFQNTINDTSNLELRNAALYIDRIAKTGNHQWGLAYWNAIVFNWVPAQFLGDSFKNSLIIQKGINFIDFCHTSSWFYQYSCRPGQTFTGMADSFGQFDYFGCLFFAFAALLFKFMWQKAVYQNSFAAQACYSLLIVRMMLTITHTTIQFPSRMLYLVVFVSPMILWSSIPKSSQKTQNVINSYQHHIS